MGRIQRHRVAKVCLVNSSSTCEKHQLAAAVQWLWLTKFLV